AQSTHPVSRSIADGYSDTNATGVLEFIGTGIAGSAFGHHVLLGSRDFVVDRVTGAERVLGKHGVTHVAIDGHYVGCFALKSSLRSGIAEMVRELFRSGKQSQVVSGDGSIDAPVLAPIFGEDLLNFNCRPEDKIQKIETAQAQGDTILMVGDGLNDAGAMGTADVAIAVTEDTATLVPACDVIIRSNAVKGIAALLDYAKRVKQVIVACFIISIVYNILGLGLAVMGLLSPLMAAILMPVSSLTVIGVSVAGARMSIKHLQRKIEETTACS
ncbi:MAG TPA: HAD-IC family P-type ATPase, partial [Candidatus Kapabacteria bacterium]|nr:HAD-IC family P-type ATPase [Candidatus Kapabacteria bacterium]